MSVEAEAVSNDPTLLGSKYVALLPKGKVANYGPNERCELDLNTDLACVDGKACYLDIELTNTSTFASGSSVNAPYPCAPYPHLGGHALIRSLQFSDLAGRKMEGAERYALQTGILNAFRLDDDDRQVAAKVEGVSGPAPRPQYNVVSEAVCNKLYIKPELDVINDVVQTTTSNVATMVTGKYCLPINLGSFSGLDETHEVLPNLPLKGTRLRIDTAPANEVMQTLSSRLVNANGRETCYNGFTNLSCDITNGNNYLDINTTVLDTTKTESDKIIFSTGQKVVVSEGANTDTLEISYTQENQGGSNNQLRLYFTSNITNCSTTSTANVKLDAPTYGYNITKIELKVLHVIPDNKTLDYIARQVQNIGYNISCVSLDKLSRVSGLKETILDLPVNYSKAMSILVAPIQSDGINNTDYANNGWNTQVFPHLNPTTTTNKFSYQWQLRNILTPDRPIAYCINEGVKSDNVLHFSHLKQALSPLMKVKCLEPSLYDLSDSVATRGQCMPFVYPVLLAPLGNSLDLLDIEPQLRITVDNTADATNVLYHIFTIHTVKIKSQMNLPVEVSI